MSDILSALGDILDERKGASADSSYVASLYAKDKSDLIYETADLWFHSLVALAHLGERPEAAIKELARRFNMSGLEEKASRSDK
mgnify:CR=1 FL=1